MLASITTTPSLPHSVTLSDFHMQPKRLRRSIEQ